MTSEERDHTRRSRPWLLAAAWVAAATAAVLVATLAVGAATRQVTDPTPVLLSQATSTPEASPSPSPSPSASPSADPSATTNRIASSLGGSAAFRFEGGRVTLLWARPEAGYEVDIERSPGEARARFRSAAHESRIKADHEDGRPRIRVEERPEDDD